MIRSLALTVLGALVVSTFVLVAGTAPARAMDMNCSDFSSQAAAQSYFIAQGGPSYDPDGLDRDGDGVACDSNPCPCSTATSPPKSPKPATPAKLKVVKVMTGELIRVRRGSQPSYVVHLMGVRLPASSCKRRAAVGDLKSWVKPGMVVRQSDDKPSKNRDSKGHFYRYLVRARGGYDIGGSQIATGFGGVNKQLRFDRKAQYLRWAKKARAGKRGYYGVC